MTNLLPSSRIRSLVGACLTFAAAGALTLPATVSAQPIPGNAAGPATPRRPTAPAPRPAAAAPAPKILPSNGTAIVATVNGEVISLSDVDNRRRLFALSTGMPMSPDVLDRLTPQVTRQLIDEKLRLQEAQRRHIVITDQDVADAMKEVEQRNNMQPGTLRRQLSTAGIDIRTLIDQLRAQIAWARTLREDLGQLTSVSAADVKAMEDTLKSEIGQPEYRVGEIFVPAADSVTSAGQSTSAANEDAHRFADTIIAQLRAGAPFAVVAAQFSQSQTALQGGDLGWVDATQIDPAVLHVLQEMPEGAISNPIRVPGGYSIVTLRGKREIGRDPATVVHVRQVFMPFAARLNPQAPTEAQRAVLEQAQRLSQSAKTCEAMDAAAKAINPARSADPGELRLDTVAIAPLRQLMATLPLQQASQPLIAEDGVAVLMVCSREERNLGLPSQKEISDRILNDRVELASRQLMRDLQRRATIDRRS